MTAQSVQGVPGESPPGRLEVIRRVEESPLQDLVAVDITDVEVQMDHLLGPETTADSLYRRWETQQWAVSALDFTQDKKDWAGLSEGLQLAYRRTMTLFFIGEQAVTDTLSPLLYAAPREDERIFLATQLADEARHTVFFQRFFAEVLGLEGGLSTALEAVRPRTVAGFRKIFDEELAGAVDLVRREPANERAWVEAVVTYHLVIEGYLALAGQHTLLTQFRKVGILPGFTAGFTAVARDESRHIGFGVMALRRRVTEQPEMARVITRKVLELLEPAVYTGVAPDRRLAIDDPTSIPAMFRVNPLEAREFAVGQLTKRVRACGISEAATGEIGDAMRAHYDRGWEEYEQNHGVRHPVRWYQDGSLN
jgi:ribonucleoside-diphosphate reductase beta chain